MADGVPLRRFTVKLHLSRSTQRRWLSFALVATLMPTWTLGVAETEEAAAVAKREYDQVMALTPNLQNGRKVFVICAVCHSPEGWGSTDGTYPQIAGQLRTVIVKQLADIRARNRDNPLMYPFAVPRVLGGAQNIADVAAYVAQLPKTADNGKGPGTDLDLGAQLFRTHCSHCHGDRGLGNEAEHLPQIAGQHYAYLVRQFDAIRGGRRKNSDPKMVKQIHGFTPREELAVLDYTSRLPLPLEKVAPEGWTNPDFPDYVRRPKGPTEEGPLPAAPLPSTTSPEG
jgi:cytochrome c553